MNSGYSRRIYQSSDCFAGLDVQVPRYTFDQFPIASFQGLRPSKENEKMQVVRDSRLNKAAVLGPFPYRFLPAPIRKCTNLPATPYTVKSYHTHALRLQRGPLPCHGPCGAVEQAER